MMLRINVAPENRVETRVGDLAPALAATALVCLAAYYIPVFYASTVNSEADELRAKTNEKRDQLKNLEFDLNKAKALQAMVNDLRARQQMIRSLSKARKQPVAVLHKLQQLHLERMWLENLNFGQDLMAVTAWATDYGVVSEYVRRLKVTTGEDSEANLDAKNFRPVFTTTEPKKQEEPGNEFAVVVPVRFSNVMLKKSALNEIEGFPIQKFDVDFNPNIETVSVGQ